MAQNETQGDHLQKLAGLIKDIDIAMLTTQEEDGTLRSRPMATQKAEFDGTLWFFTRADSGKVAETQREHHVNVSYAATKGDTYVSVSGRAQIVRDRASIDRYWQESLRAWFPDGKDDPNIALIRVAVERAEYWDVHSRNMVQIAGYAVARVTGQRPDTSQLGDHGTIDLGTAAETR